MKQGKALITFVMALLAAALTCYLGYYVWDTFQEPFTTTYTYEYELNDSVEAEGLIVRQEQVLPGAQGILDITRGEGEQVGLGQRVGLVYRDDQAQQAQEQQEALRMELIQLQYAIGQGGDAASAAKVDEDILQALVALRSSAALDDYSTLENQVLEVKSGVLRREYAYGAELSAVDLAARLNEMTAQYETLRAQNYAAVTQITAPVSGTFSALVDGYETLIDLNSALQLTPEGLSGLMKQPPEADRTAAGKLITSNRWQFAVLVSQEEGERLAQESRVTLRFASDFTQDIPMEVIHVGEAENGQTVVVLSTDRCLEQTTLLRRQTAELIFDSRIGLRVPKGAVRMIDGTQTDEETGETTQYSTLGVYVVTAGRAEFKPIEILAEGDEFYVVRSVNQDRKALRAGDEVVIRGTGLYDGKLLEF
ncbi:MAG: hypothetical protein KH028_01930 [Oscillospiraceae bacterium]|jgi:hypothetical protein|nr:hypothetical protein [Oscillospiraceae bacterium]